MSRLRLVLAFLLGAALAAGVFAFAPPPAPAEVPPVVIQGHQVPASALAGSARAIDRIYVLEHEKLALQLALDALRDAAGPAASGPGALGPGILPSMGHGLGR